MSMSVHELRNVVLLFSNPSWSGVSTVPTTITKNITALSSKIAYSASYSDNITVLTSKYAETTNGVIQGLLYVPDLGVSGECVDEMLKWVPDSAVHQDDLPPTDYNLIAIIPWISVNCTKEYLESARSDPLRAMVVYLPGNTTDQPPDASSSVWELGDGGRWKTQNHFPIYAVSGAVGGEMMHQLSLYSGNVSEVPYGHNITNLYQPDDDAYVRIWTELDVSTSSNIPDIWVFFLVIAGVLLTVVLSTSFLMHFVQGRRRASLRRRVISGEVNLEGMGIARLKVPRDHVQKFPLFTYHYEPDDHSPPKSPTSPTSPTSPKTSRASRADDIRSSRGPAGSTAGTNVSRALTVSEKGLSSPFAASTVATDYQPLCLICLDSFENRVSIIREISCGHIFHPECIDEFLGDISSLCPLCKACILPKGYCPTITAAMVRRELAIRKLRDQVIVDETDDESVREQGWVRTWASAFKRHIFPRSNSKSSASELSSTELQPQPQKRKSTAARRSSTARDFVQRRSAGAAAAGAPSVEVTRARMRQLAWSPLDDDERGLPKWKRMRNKVFPGFY